MADQPTGCLVHVAYTLDAKAATRDVFVELTCVVDSALACLDAIEDPAVDGCLYLLRHAAVLLDELERRQEPHRTEKAHGDGPQPRPADGSSSLPPPDKAFSAPADLVAVANSGCFYLEGLIDLVQATINESRVDDGKVLACAAVLEQVHKINGAIGTVLCGDADSIESVEAYRLRMFGRVVGLK